jgi:hypothetical protein
MPKFFLKNIVNLKSITNNIQLDYYTNYFVILKNNKAFINTDDFILKNKYLKLHKFRYKS